MDTTIVDRCISYCASFDPGFPAQIQGASPEQIARLTAACGRAPSALHRSFLERLGGQRAWLDFGAFDPSIEALIRAHETTPDPPPAGAELFAVATDEPFEDAFLVGDGEEAPVEVHVTSIGVGHARFDFSSMRPLAGSLPSLICLAPLTRYTLDAMPLQARLSRSDPPPDVLDAVDGAFSQAAFAPLWFSDRTTRICVRGTTYALARAPVGYPLTLWIASTDRATFDATLLAFGSALPLTRDA